MSRKIKNLAEDSSNLLLIMARHLHVFDVDGSFLLESKLPAQWGMLFRI